MRTDYDGVKFYSRYDMSVGWELKKAEPIIIDFSAEKKIEDINEILELFNIQQLFEIGVALPEWNDEVFNAYKKKTQLFTDTLGKFFSRINDSSFEEYIQGVAIGYLDDFWKLFVRFKVYHRVSEEKFAAYLQLPDTTLNQILKHKDLVRHYDKPLAKVLRNSDQTYQMLTSNFLEKNDVNYYFPPSFSPCEYEGIFQKYIASGNANPNVLKLIFNAQSTADCPISDKLKLNAKREYDEYWKKSGKNVVNTEYGFSISFADQDELIKCNRKGMKFHISYDIKWFEKNLDYPTIMKNFSNVFEMFDMCWRSTLVSVKSQISALEKAFTVKGIRFYQRGNHFDWIDMISTAQMTMYYDFLKVHDIDLEMIFEWFFNEYLPEEFGVVGFSMKASSAANYVERCRTLASEMDGVLKQFRMYVRDGTIDRELFEISSEHLVIDGIQSFIQDKYAYPSGREIQNEMFMLFSDQSTLSYTSKTQTKYPTLFQMIKQENILIDDFEQYQISDIKWLIERGALRQNDGGSIELNIQRVGVLKDMYDHDVTCIRYLGGWTDALYEMKSAGDIRIENTLFSEPETDYLNYKLNKSEFSDGLDLRNKYVHSTYPQDEYVQRRDYIELLKIMVLIITKIYEEFCWWKDRKKVPINEL